MSQPSSTTAGALPAAHPAPANTFWRRALRNPSFVIGAVLTLALLLAAAISYVWTPWSPYEMNL
ncbi:MAG: ABC transporter permease, partial [Comamonas sp.]